MQAMNNAVRESTHYRVRANSGGGRGTQDIQTERGIYLSHLRQDTATAFVESSSEINVNMSIEFRVVLGVVFVLPQEFFRCFVCYFHMILI